MHGSDVKFRSIYDGETEYRIGFDLHQRMNDDDLRETCGGFYCYGPPAAVRALYPGYILARCLPLTCLGPGCRVRGGGFPGHRPEHQVRPRQQATHGKRALPCCRGQCVLTVRRRRRRRRRCQQHPPRGRPGGAQVPRLGHSAAVSQRQVCGGAVTTHSQKPSIALASHPHAQAWHMHSEHARHSRLGSNWQ